MIELRRATAADLEFCGRVVAVTIRPHAEQTWGTYDESASRKSALRLRVLNVNPARRLYEREGFRVTSTTPERTYMELSA